MSNITLSNGLFCPICHKGDQMNRVNGLPWCMKCGHQLVYRDELKRFNREYRRTWKAPGDMPFKGLSVRGVNVVRTPKEVK